MQAEATLNLMRRYRDVFRAVWAERHALAPVVRRPEEAEFLPAALALQEAPMSPAPRMLMWIVMGAVAIAVAWASFGRIDIVAIAHGKIVDSGRSKVIQPVETATIKAIRVTDGKAVRAGDTLVELDATQADADLRRVQSDLATARLQAVRGRAFLAAMDGGKAALASDPSIPRDMMQREQDLLAGQVVEYRARLARLDAETARREGELAAIRETVRKLEKTTPIAKQRAEDFKSLVDRNFVSKHGYLDREQVRIEQEADLSTQRSRIRELTASVQEAQGQRAALEAETRRGTLDSIREAEQKVAMLEEERVKASARTSLLSLTAPVDGTVQQLAIHTVGGVVTPAQALMVIVPKDRELEIEAAVENKDIGFVNAGQVAEVKVETFPFTRYGTIPADIISVSNDAAADEKKGLFFPARVRLSQTTMNVDGKQINLSPGMAVTVEVKTGHRQVIDYFLSPLFQYKQGSLHER